MPGSRTLYTFAKVAGSPRAVTNTIVRREATSRAMATQNPAALNIQSLDIKTSPGVELNEQQKIIVGSVLDLFKGKPSLKKLSLWDPNATFRDPITNAVGFDKYAAQWYGLKAAFSDIKQDSHLVEDNGNPIKLDLNTTYTVKGAGTVKPIHSKIEIHTKPDESGQPKITRVEDKWDGEIGDGAFKNVSLFHPWSILGLAGQLAFWAFVKASDTWPWEVRDPMRSRARLQLPS